ncbi:nucleotide sugar dehydrogenase [Limnospira fusiformis]|uniref:nucleotide sugar dehydrogenase n=1 Tax=Limnospira fusiformis TaxID=54297 RepID=UPI002AA27C23|nr:nucleotide sugar dehydrogenase [Limnospira fusiformis LS22]
MLIHGVKNMVQNHAKIFNNLKNKIENRTVIVGIVGLGYVGLPLAVEKAKAGFQVIGIEKNPVRADKVNQADNYIGDVRDQELTDVVRSGKLRALTDFEIISEVDVIVICVPSPLTKNLTPNLIYIEDVTKEIAHRLKPGQLISLESTTYPGTTDELMKPILEEISGFNQGKDFFLAYSPERVDPGNRHYNTQNTCKIVGASDSKSLQVARLFYQQTIVNIIPVSSAKSAELAKIFENTFRAVNIALVNELAMLCDRLQLNVWEVLDAANTKPFGIMPFYPGPGVGGHCIPLDPHYLEWKARELNFNTHFIALAGEVNRKMPQFVREKTWRVLNHNGIAPSKAHILIIGVAYKKDVGDWRESPALEVIDFLLEDGVNLIYHDPYVPNIRVGSRDFSSVELTDVTISTADLVLITTDHSQIDYINLVEKAQAVLDTRGVTRKLDCNKERVTLL